MICPNLDFCCLCMTVFHHNSCICVSDTVPKLCANALREHDAEFVQMSLAVQ